MMTINPDQEITIKYELDNTGFMANAKVNGMYFCGFGRDRDEARRAVLRRIQDRLQTTLEVPPPEKITLADIPAIIGDETSATCNLG
jgi:hypothetical protein